MEVAGGWSWVQQNVLAVEANMVSLKGLVTPEDHLTPQVRVLSTLVHGSVWLEVGLNEILVLVNSGLDFLITCLILKYSIEISSHGVLLIMESVEVHSLDGMNVHGHKLTKGAPKNGKAKRKTYL